jgi:spoIIIJ-associated protein
VKDRAFTGRDVAEAVRAAAVALGLPEGRIRYFVLDPGRPGAFGVAPTQARIAVLMEGSPPPTPSLDEEGAGEGDAAPAAELATRLNRVTRALGEAAGLDLEGEVVEDREAVTLKLRASDPGFLLGEDGEGAPARALEHLLHRMFATDVTPLRLRVELAGYREARDEVLRQLALRLAGEVRRDGAPRETAPLNAYERRIVHMAVAAAGGVSSRSEGEGAARRVVLTRVAGDGAAGGEVH